MGGRGVTEPRVPNQELVSVVIPAHNAASTLGRQLAALAGQQHPPRFEVVVAMNRCTDTTADVVESFESSLLVRGVVADEHGSAAYARNVGASAASGAVLLFCDADDEVGPHWVAGMADALRHCDFVGGLIEVERDELPDWMYRWRYQRIDQTCVRPGLLPYVVTASFGIRADVFQSVGGFDQSFSGAAGEDVDLSRRLLRSGYRLGVAPAATVSYTPRRTMRGALAQSRAYSTGDLVLAAKERALLPSRSPLALVGYIVKVAAHHVVREGERHPLVLYGLARQNFDRWVEHRRMERSRGVMPVEDPPHVDFMVPFENPLIGGLAFAARDLDDATRNAAEGATTRLLTVLECHLTQGGVFVDVGAHIGLLSVAAAMVVGPTGRVVAVESDVDRCAVLRTNLARHGADATVEVRVKTQESDRPDAAFVDIDDLHASVDVLVVDVLVVDASRFDAEAVRRLQRMFCPAALVVITTSAGLAS